MRLFIRTEASSQIGMGHFMRCFAVAEEARKQGLDVTFLLNEIGEAVKLRLGAIAAAGLAVGNTLGTPADFMAMSAQDLKRDDWLLIDSYQASEDYIVMAHKASRVAVLDDLCALQSYDCDLIVNPAMAAMSMPYARRSNARLLLGADYALIRQEFCLPQTAPPEPFIAVMFGGSDPNGLTATVAQRLRLALPDMALRLIAGPAMQNLEALTDLAGAEQNIRLFPDPLSLSRVLAGAALVITAAGGSVGEVAAMGLPALVLVAYDNQAAALSACPYPVIDVRGGLPGDLGARVSGMMADPPRLADNARKAHALVDGRGAQRIIEAMRR